jgi:predicted AAA+ superfamily ATPase
MFRKALDYLEKKWINDRDRKPLVLRGARQVGKTWLVRELSKRLKKQLVEINFEQNPQLKSLFETNNPKSILQNIETYFGTKVESISSLLFLDEIQEAPEILAKLRWFYEGLPELPVIATGSLLEFILQSSEMSMPVGRITYMHLEPLSFEEFLQAQGAEGLLTYLREIEPPFIIPAAIHQSLQEHFRKYLRIGGMPAVVIAWIKDQSIESVKALQEDLLTTYRDDFFKYKGRIEVQRLDTIFRAVPVQLGQKFVCSKAAPSIQVPAIKQILSLFNKARVCHLVQSSSGNGVPLKAEVKDKVFKQIFLDVGLVNQFLGNDLLFSKGITEGRLSEQVVGQMLRTLFPFYKEPSLYYWQREEKGSQAEIDYLLEHKGEVIPIEVKSGSTGSLKSLHLFMNIKRSALAVRLNDSIPSITAVKIKNGDEPEISYTLLSLPFYLTSQIHRLLDFVHSS